MSCFWERTVGLSDARPLGPGFRRVVAEPCPYLPVLLLGSHASSHQYMVLGAGEGSRVVGNGDCRCVRVDGLGTDTRMW
jgi:hypothetical protein